MLLHHWRKGDLQEEDQVTACKIYHSQSQFSAPRACLFDLQEAPSLGVEMYTSCTSSKVWWIYHDFSRGFRSKHVLMFRAVRMLFWIFRCHS